MPTLVLRNADLAETWVAAGRPADKVPAELTVSLLGNLVRLMLQGGGDVNWRTSMFIASAKASAKAQQIQEADEEARRKKEDVEREPPPLQ